MYGQKIFCPNEKRYFLSKQNRMKYNPQIHHRRSIRLKGYDYLQAGLYFVTICCHNRECFFGEIRMAMLRMKM